MEKIQIPTSSRKFRLVHTGLKEIDKYQSIQNIKCKLCGWNMDINTTFFFFLYIPDIFTTLS